MELKSQWTKFYSKAQKNLIYPDISLCDAVWSVADKNPDNTALVYMGRKITYKELKAEILHAQQMLINAGVKPSDRVAVCLPNIPQAVYLLYGIDRLGAVAVFVHPLSAVEEIVRYVKTLGADCLVALDSMYPVITEVLDSVDIKSVIFTSPADELPFAKRVMYKLKNKIRTDSKIVNFYTWLNLKAESKKTNIHKTEVSPEDTAVVLFSGGTTGQPKGVMLSGKALNAMAIQTAAMSGCDIQGKTMVSAMPVFHGFGLCVCVHTVLSHGGACILVPRFTVGEYAKILKKYSPDFIAGVPTLFEALMGEKSMKKVDLGCLSGVFCGGDVLPIKLKKSFDLFLKEHGAKVKIREGYGATECVTASCLTPYNMEKEGSIGIPFPDTYYKICEEGTEKEAPVNSVGEICISGPAVMKGYFGDDEETKKVLKTHSDGRVWLHTQDAGKMDEDGFVYFSHRLRRVIISSGYNIYPQAMERIIEEHPKVSACCVVGIKDVYKMERVKAFVVPCEEVSDEDAFKEELTDYMRKRIARYALPSIVELISALPINSVGKIEYSKLSKEA